jgi:hypothetical protein
MKLPCYTLRVIFALSVFSSLFWLVGIVVEPIIKKEPPLYLLAAIVLMITTATSGLLFRNDRLIPSPATPLGQFMAKIVILLISSYIVLVPIIGVLAWCALRLTAVFSPAILGHDFWLFIVIFALWFPLWLSPAIASYLFWRTQGPVQG